MTSANYCRIILSSYIGSRSRVVLSETYTVARMKIVIKGINYDSVIVMIYMYL